MAELLINNEAWIRAAFFVGIMLIMMATDTMFPRHRREISQLMQWADVIFFMENQHREALLDDNHHQPSDTTNRFIYSHKKTRKGTKRGLH